MADRGLDHPYAGKNLDISRPVVIQRTQGRSASPQTQRIPVTAMPSEMVEPGQLPTHWQRFQPEQVSSNFQKAAHLMSGQSQSRLPWHIAAPSIADQILLAQQSAIYRPGLATSRVTAHPQHQQVLTPQNVALLTGTQTKTSPQPHLHNKTTGITIPSFDQQKLTEEVRNWQRLPRRVSPVSNRISPLDTIQPQDLTNRLSPFHPELQRVSPSRMHELHQGSPSRSEMLLQRISPIHAENQKLAIPLPAHSSRLSPVSTAQVLARLQSSFQDSGSNTPQDRHSVSPAKIMTPPRHPSPYHISDVNQQAQLSVAQSIPRLLGLLQAGGLFPNDHISAFNQSNIISVPPGPILMRSGNVHSSQLHRPTPMDISATIATAQLARPVALDAKSMNLAEHSHLKIFNRNRSPERLANGGSSQRTHLENVPKLEVHVSKATDTKNDEICKLKTPRPPDLVKMPVPFNTRPGTLNNFPSTSHRPTYRSHSIAMHRAKAGCITSAAKSLDLLRQNLQKNLNKEIDSVIQKYIQKYFKFGMDNIKLNNGETTVNDDHLLGVCRQVMEEAKKMYCDTRSSTPAGEISDNISEAGSHVVDLQKKRIPRVIINKKRRHSDSDSETSIPVNIKKKNRRFAHLHGGSGRLTPSKSNKPEVVKREGPKWEPERLTEDTMFVMGAKANKALGLGNTRGRLYIKHPDVFKYSGDQDDKQWLYEHGYMPAVGGKAYMLLVDDIKDLSQTDEYRDSPGLLLHHLFGFSVPEWMLQKMRSQMQNMRTDIKGGRVIVNSSTASRSVTPVDKETSSVVSMDQTDNLSDIGDDLDKTLPFTGCEMKADAKSVVQVSPANTDLDMLSAGDDSPLAVGLIVHGFNYSVSPLRGLVDDGDESDGPPLTAPFDPDPH